MRDCLLFLGLAGVGGGGDSLLFLGLAEVGRDTQPTAPGAGTGWQVMGGHTAHYSRDWLQSLPVTVVCFNTHSTSGLEPDSAKAPFLLPATHPTSM